MTVLNLIEKRDRKNVILIDRLVEQVELKAKALREKIKNDDFRLHKNIKQLEKDAVNLIDKESSIIFLADGLGLFFDELSQAIRETKDFDFDYLASVMLEVNSEIVEVIKALQEIEDRFES